MTVEFKARVPGGSYGNYATATADSTSPPLTGLQTSPAGMSYTPGFVWNYGAQIGTAAHFVTLRITPSEASGADHRKPVKASSRDQLDSPRA